MDILEITSYLLVFVSAIIKGIALLHLNNKNRAFEVSKKMYMKFNIVSYLLLVPGVILFVYCKFL